MKCQGIVTSISNKQKDGSRISGEYVVVKHSPTSRPSKQYCKQYVHSIHRFHESQTVQNPVLPTSDWTLPFSLHEGASQTLLQLFAIECLHRNNCLCLTSHWLQLTHLPLPHHCTLSHLSYSCISIPMSTLCVSTLKRIHIFIAV